MSGASQTFECTRCGTAFEGTDDHTEIVRRDFVGVPRPSKVDRFCRDCWRAYVEDFLEADFEQLLESYPAEQPTG